MNRQTEILVCPARFEYQEGYNEINPWMGERYTVDSEVASKQWGNMFKCIRFCVGNENIRLIKPEALFPDMIFVRNAGIVIPRDGHSQKKRVILASFKHKERQGEREFYRKWFEQNGFEIISLPDSVIFEGGGEAIWWKQTLFFGYGFRASMRDAVSLGLALDGAHVKGNMLLLELIDKRFYHLDTAFMPIRGDGENTGDVLVYYPGAFSKGANKIIESLQMERIAVTEEDACAFGCNLLALGNNIIMAKGTKKLASILKEHGFIVFELNMNEIKKGGGSVYCMTLNLS